MVNTADSIGHTPAHPGMPMVVPIGVVKFATSAPTPTVPSCRMLSGSVATLDCVANAVVCAGSTALKNVKGGTCATNFSNSPLTTNAWMMLSTKPSTRMLSSASSASALDVVAAVEVAPSTTTAYGVSSTT